MAAWAVFFWPMLIDGMVPVFRDILDTTVPLGHYIGERLRSGHLPQWFPYEGLGEPFIGQLNESTFHPTSWLYAIFSIPTALRWELLLGYLAAAFGQLLLARKLGMSLTASALAAVVFAFSGYAISLSNVLPYLWGMASLPWLGLCAARVFTSDRPWPWIAALALCWASIVVAGDSHSALFGGLVVVFVGAQTGGLRRLPLCVLASMLAIGIAGAELLPAIDIVKAGPRANWNAIAESRISAVWALHPYRLPELLFPNWIPSRTHVFFSNERFVEGGVWALSIFAGVPTLALALAGLLSRTRRGLLAGALTLLGLWLALGYHGGLEPALRHVLPILNVLRYPEKHLAIWTFGLSLSAAAGLDRLRARPGVTFPLALALFGGACAVAAVMLPGDIALRVWPRLAQARVHIPLLHKAWHDSLFATAISSTACAVLLAAGRRQAGAFALLPLAIFLELWVANGTLIGVAPASVLTDAPRLCVAARRNGGTLDGLRVVNVSSRKRMYDELEEPEVWAAITRNLMQPAANVLCDIGSVWSLPILSNEPRAVRDVLGRGELPPALQLYGFGLYVRAYPEDRPMPQETVVGAAEIPGKTLLLVKRPAAPRVYAAIPRWVADAAAARDAVKRGLPLAGEPVLVGSGPAFDGTGAAGTVRIVQYEPEHVVLEAQMERAGAVILNDLDWPGWSATLDGAPVRIYNANALARAVLVPAGAHRIEMQFTLPRLRTGLAVSAASLLLCAVLVIAGLVNRTSPARASHAAPQNAA